MERRGPDWINRPIAATAEYVGRAIPDRIEVCPNCKQGFLWHRDDKGWLYCAKCGIEGPGLAGKGITFIRAAALPSDAAAHGCAAVSGGGDPVPLR